LNHFSKKQKNRLLIELLLYLKGNLFHQPVWGGSCSANANRINLSEPGRIYFGTFCYMVGSGIFLFTNGIQIFAVGTFMSGHKKDQFMTACKLPQVGNPVGNLPADGVFDFQGNPGFMPAFIFSAIA
jgi:hypothetical protein